MSWFATCESSTTAAEGSANCSDMNELTAEFLPAVAYTSSNYPIPVHLQPCSEGFPFSPDSLSVTESVAKRVISLPMYPELTRSQIEFVCDRVREFPAN